MKRRISIILIVFIIMNILPLEKMVYALENGNDNVFDDKYTREDYLRNKGRISLDDNYVVYVKDDDTVSYNADYWDIEDNNIVVDGIEDWRNIKSVKSNGKNIIGLKYDYECQENCMPDAIKILYQ